MSVLLTGATGTLGVHLLPALRSAGLDVTALTRRPGPYAEGARWVRGDLRTGEGLAASLEGCEVVVHAATDGGAAGGTIKMRYAFVHPAKTDIDGTQRMIEAARAAGVKHFVYVSIVGIDRVTSYRYFAHKLAAEELVADGGVAHTIARVTQFHEFIDALIRFALRSPIALTVRDIPVQSIAARDAASAIARVAAGPPADKIVEVGGPEVTTAGAAADVWLGAHGSKRRIRNVPAFGRTVRALRSGALCTDDRSGTITWSSWLGEKTGEER